MDIIGVNDVKKLPACFAIIASGQYLSVGIALFVSTKPKKMVEYSICVRCSPQTHFDSIVCVCVCCVLMSYRFIIVVVFNGQRLKIRLAMNDFNWKMVETI